MFYTTEKRDHGLPHDPFKALVVPRPIGWVSTISEEGVPNLAPFSAAFECKLWKSIELPTTPGRPGSGYTSLIVSVVGVYIDDQYIVDGMVDTAAMQPIARLGYMDYSVVSADNMFSLNRPDVAEDGKTATLKSGPWDGAYR